MPGAILNVVKCGDWAGRTAEIIPYANVGPWPQILVNMLVTAMGNVAAPVFPWGSAWRGWMELAATFASRGSQTARSRSLWAIALAFWAAYFVFCAKNGGEKCRLLTPYYIGMLLPLLATGSDRWLRRRWATWGAAIAFATAFGITAIQPQRPLFPALTLLEKLRQWKPDSASLQRAQTVYRTYRDRRHAMRVFNESFGREVRNVGYFGINLPEVPLWEPFHSRKIVSTYEEVPADWIDRHDVDVVIIHPSGFHGAMGDADPLEWGKAHGLTLEREVPGLQLWASSAPETWLVMRRATPR